MESALVSIFIDAIEKVAAVTGFKLFLLLESPDGVRRLGGDGEMVDAFLKGPSVPEVSDQTVETREDSYEIGADCEEACCGLDSSDAGRRSRKRSSAVANQSASLRKRKKIKVDDDRKISKTAESMTRKTSDTNPNPKTTQIKTDLDVEKVDNRSSDRVVRTNEADLNVSSENDSSNSKDEETTWKAGGPGFRSTDTLNGKKKCGLCPPENSKTYRFKAYWAHKSRVHDRKQVCPRCNNGFSSPSQMKKHNCKPDPKKT